MNPAIDSRLERLRADIDEAFPRRDGEPLPLWLRRALGQGYLCRQELDNLLAYFDAEIGPMPDDEDDEERFALRNEKPKAKPWRPEPPERKRQKTLLAGLDCLPGQGDLFPTDGNE